MQYGTGKVRLQTGQQLVVAQREVYIEGVTGTFTPGEFIGFEATGLAATLVSHDIGSGRVLLVPVTAVSAARLFWQRSDDTLTSIAVVGTEATITTSTPHGLIAGRRIRISGGSVSLPLNGNYTVVSAPTTTTFTVTVAGVVSATYVDLGLRVGTYVVGVGSGATGYFFSNIQGLTTFLSKISAGQIFSRLSSGVPYSVGAVVDDYSFNLSAAYVGPSEIDAPYTVTTSIDPDTGIPYPEPGDQDNVLTIKSGMLRIAGLLSRVVGVLLDPPYTGSGGKSARVLADESGVELFSAAALDDADPTVYQRIVKATEFFATSTYWPRFLKTGITANDGGRAEFEKPDNQLGANVLLDLVRDSYGLGLKILRPGHTTPTMLYTEDHDGARQGHIATTGIMGHGGEGPILMNGAEVWNGEFLLDHVVLEQATATGGSPTTLIRSGAGWAADQHNGRTVEILAGMGAGQRRDVVDTQGGNTLLVLPAWEASREPDATSVYRIYEGWRNRVAARALDFTALTSGVVTSAAAGYLRDTSKVWANDLHNGRIVQIVAGTGAGQTRTITDTIQVTNELQVSPNWTTVPDSTSHYRVYDGSEDTSLVSIARVEDSLGLYGLYEIKPTAQQIPNDTWTPHIWESGSSIVIPGANGSRRFAVSMRNNVYANGTISNAIIMTEAHYGASGSQIDPLVGFTSVVAPMTAGWYVTLVLDFEFVPVAGHLLTLYAYPTHNSYLLGGIAGAAVPNITVGNFLKVEEVRRKS